MDDAPEIVTPRRPDPARTVTRARRSGWEIRQRPGSLTRSYYVRSWTGTWGRSSCAVTSARVDQYVASAGSGSRVALAAATRASIRAACGPYISNIVSELRTEFLTLTSFENSTVPPSAA